MDTKTKRLIQIWALTASLILLAGIIGMFLTKDIEIETALSFIVDVILK